MMQENGEVVVRDWEARMGFGLMASESRWAD